jgi:hypothetical protein
VTISKIGTGRTIYASTTVETGTATVIISIGTDKDTTVVIKKHKNQCCGAETICFGSSSEFQKVSAPASALWVPVRTVLNNNFDF